MYENHFDIIRNTNEKSTNEEFEIAVNGPNLAHCDSVVKEAVDNFGPVEVGSGIFSRPQFWRHPLK